MTRSRDLVLNTVLVVLTALLILGLVWLITRITGILILILISVILAAGLGPPVARLQRLTFGRRRPRNISQTGAILIIYAGLIALVLLFSGALITPLVRETTEFAANLPQNLAKLQQYSDQIRARYRWVPDFSRYLANLPDQIAGLTRHLGTAAAVIFRFFGGIVSLVTILFMTFYMLVEGPHIRREFLTLFPAGRREQVGVMLEDVGQKFGGWVRGQLLLGAIIGVAAGIGTWILGLPYPFLLGLVAGITELIPIVGPFLGAIPAVLIALFVGPWWRVIATLVLYIVIQQAEANFVVPRVMRAAVGISPLLTVIALLIGAQLLGIMGALLSIPVAAALQVVVGEALDMVRRGNAADRR